MSDRDKRLAPTSAAEAALIGALSLWPDEADRLPHGLSEIDFADRGLGRLFGVIQRRHRAGRAIDPASVATELVDDDADRLAECIDGADWRNKASAHAEAILRAGVKRQLQTGLTALAKQAASGDVDPRHIFAELATLATAAESRLTGSTSDAGTTAAEGFAAVLRDARAAASGERQGISTGFRRLDENLGGFRPGELWILGARPGQGKSTLAAQWAFDAATAGRYVAFASLEMSAAGIYGRLAASATGINPIRLRNGRLRPAEWAALESATSAAERELGNRLQILDRTGSNVAAILAQFRLRHRQNRLDLAVIDFAQRLDGGHDSAGLNRNAELERASRAIADFAHETRVPVLLLSQLNRLGEGVVPSLANLRDSGSLEADADVILFLSPDESRTDARRLTVAKARDGSVDGFDVVLDVDRMRFTPAE